jgi:hypothetical protein
MQGGIIKDAKRASGEGFRVVHPSDLGNDLCDSGLCLQSGIDTQSAAAASKFLNRDR